MELSAREGLDPPGWIKPRPFFKAFAGDPEAGQLQGFGFGVSGLGGFGVEGLGFGVQGLGFGVNR